MKTLAITHIETNGETLARRCESAKTENRLWAPLRSWRLRAKHLRPREVKRFHRWAFFDL